MQLANPFLDRSFAPPAQQSLGRAEDSQHLCNGQYTTINHRKTLPSQEDHPFSDMGDSHARTSDQLVTARLSKTKRHGYARQNGTAMQDIHLRGLNADSAPAAGMIRTDAQQNIILLACSETNKVPLWIPAGRHTIRNTSQDTNSGPQKVHATERNP
jgi:hypothetical protein